MSDGAYHDNPEPSGQSLQLSSDALNATANDDAANWCFTPAAASYGARGAGTPGEGNSGCP